MFLQHLEERRAQNYRSTRRLGEHDTDLIGLLGELALAEFFGSAPDLNNKPRGDRGVDRTITLTTKEGERTFAVDVKGSAYGDLLRVEASKPLDLHKIYVLARCVPNAERPFKSERRCVKWTWGWNLRNAEIQDRGWGPMRVMHVDDPLMRDMQELRERFVRINKPVPRSAKRTSPAR